MTVKKAFQPIIDLLSLPENANKKVKELLGEVTELCSAKGAGGAATTFVRDENGVVTFVRDYYFGLWFPTSHVDFGPKQGSPSGLNSMCKEGVSNWTKQQREFRTAKESLLTAVAAGEVAVDQIQAKLAELEDARTRVIPYSVEGLGFETLEAAQAVSKEQLDRIVARHNEKLAKLAQEQAKAAETVAAA